MNTRYYKDSYGSQAAKTEVEIAGGRSLIITTSKRSSGRTSSSIIVGTIDDNCFIYAPFSDFSLQIRGYAERCTAKNVKQLHEEALLRVDSFISLANDFYTISVD